MVQYLFAGFGRQKKVEDLCPQDVDTYISRREQGLVLEDGSRLTPVRDRAVEGDLQLLRTMLTWATRVKENGQWLLKENPLRGMELPKEENPRRAVATYDRFLLTVQAMQALAAKAPQRRGRLKWIRAELALVLAEATGRRIGSIRGLQWADIDFEVPSIWWNPDFDKKRHENTIPIPKALAETLLAFRAKLEAFGDGWLFPVADGDEPWPREMFDPVLRKAEQRAGLPKLSGALWHAFRRKWATERKHFPVADLLKAGAWKDAPTLQNCYVQTDEGTVLAVMECPNKLMSRKPGTTG